MSLLIIGLVLWIGVHLFPSLAPNTRKALSGKLGEMPYQGLFSLCILSSVALIIIGWRNSATSPVYDPMPTLGTIAIVLVVVGFILMAAANSPNTRVKRFIRHPQLTGVLLWAIAHLLTNGDSRSLLLFSALTFWSVVSMITINLRDGPWQKPQTYIPLYMDVIIIVIGVVLALVMVWFHEYLSGVSLVGV
ncbi:MAG: NnrU family protein [Candidatus Thiodiazotropha sp. DIVDIV]